MLIHLNNILISLIFILNIFLFNVYTLNINKSEKENIAFEAKIIDKMKNNYQKKIFFDNYIKKKVFNYFDKNNLLKKIFETYTDQACSIFRKHYYFLNDNVYIKYEVLLFENEVSLENITNDIILKKKTIIEHYFKKGRLVSMTRNNKIITDKKKILKQQKYILSNLNSYLFLSKYLNLPNYREYKGGAWGMRKRFPLCGRERALKLTYTFNKPIFIEIIDSNEERMYEIQEIPKKNKKTKIKRIFLILKNKKFDLDSIQISITSLAKGSEWNLKIEFEGDEIQ